MERPKGIWYHSLSNEDIFNKEFRIGYLLQTNTHIPLIAELKDKVLATYKVKAKFVFRGFNGHSIYCNGQCLIHSRSKFDKEFILGPNVTLLENNLTICGSNKYPAIASKQGQYAIVEFISFGLPFVDTVNGWSIELITLEQIH
jgi:hypothetical protein